MQSTLMRCLVIFSMSMFVLLQSCTTLWYSNNYEYKKPTFKKLNSSDTLAVLFLQYGDRPTYKLYVDTLYSLFANHANLATVRSDSIIARLIKQKVFTLPQNLSKEVLASIHPYTQSRYLMTIDVQEWKNVERGSYGNESGSIKLRFCLFDMQDLELQHCTISEMYIRVSRDDGFYIGRSLYAVATELVYDTFHRKLLKVYTGIE
jgi:hypothetical protein